MVTILPLCTREEQQTLEEFLWAKGMKVAEILYAKITLEGSNMINKSYSVTDRMHHIKIYCSHNEHWLWICIP
jgi:hypothetical protein